MGDERERGENKKDASGNDIFVENDHTGDDRYESVDKKNDGFPAPPDGDHDAQA